MKIGLSRELPGEVLPRLREVFDAIEVFPGKTPPTPEALRRLLKDKEVAIILLTERIDRELLLAAPLLKLIVTFSVGVDHIDLGALHERGVRLCHTPAVLTEATADLAFSLVLSCGRWLRPAMRKMEAGEFRGINADEFLGTEMMGSVFGIFGMGRIGRAVARRAQAFGCEVIYHDYLGRNFPEGRGVTKEELLVKSDILSLHCPLTPSTRHWIGPRELNLMKNEAVLINVARGPVIDEGALENHLRAHPHFRAGLDVYEKEPLVAGSLVELPNVVCLPHIGSATVKTRQKMADLCVAEAIRFAKGEGLLYEYRKQN